MADDIETIFQDATRWRDEARQLRAILLDCGLDEALRWGKPTYRHHGGNVAQIQRLNAALTLLFFKGALLDADGTLEAPGANSRIARRMRFASLADIAAQEAALRRHVARAMQLEDEGAKVEPAAGPELPPELVASLDADAALARAFAALTPGRQRGWALQIGGARQPATRAARIDRARPAILAGKGPNDR